MIGWRALLLVGMGGTFGSAARIWLGLTAQRLSDDGTIMATLAANTFGTAVIGWLAARDLHPASRAFWMTGFCGGFTTFSMLSFEVMMLLDRSLWQAAGYALAILCLCAGSVTLGYRAGKTI
jgi:fluoride exporter